MNNRAVTLSLFMAGFAVFFVYSYVTKIEEQARKKFGTEVWVLKAKRDINEQENITEAMIEPERVPKRFLEPSAIFIEPKDVDNTADARALEKETTNRIRQLIGTVAVVPIRKGEQISLNKITDPGIRTGLAPQISPGRRAVAIPVNEVSGVAKLVKPGDRVDVIAVIDTGQGKQNRMVKTVLQDVVVLAVGRSVTNNAARIVERDPVTGKDRVKSLAEDSSFSSVTLEVEPGQAQTLSLLMANGDSTLNLALRNNDDTDKSIAAPVTMQDVLSGQRMPASGGHQ